MTLIKVPNISAKSTLGTLASHFMMFELRQTKEIHSVFPQSWVTWYSYNKQEEVTTSKLINCQQKSGKKHNVMYYKDLIRNF